MLLPASATVDVSKLSRIFSNVTNSYKFLFFQALLHTIKSTSPNMAGSGVKIDLLSLVSSMIDTARPLLEEYRLSFGVQDRMSDILKSMIDEKAGNREMEKLKRYVPFRLLAPFFEDALCGVVDHQKNALISRHSNESFWSPNPPLYRVDPGNGFLVLHPVWVRYIQENFPIVKDWFQFQWLSYLQDRNLAVPNLKHKIDPDEARKSIPKPYKEYWNDLLRDRDVRCLYTGSLLKPGNYALDHYIPYSYVAHNELWNLVPSRMEANSSKNDRLAAEDSIRSFLDTQYLGICFHKRVFQQETFSKVAESYMTGLKIERRRILEKSVFQERLREVILNLRDCAKLTGFPDGWSYREDEDRTARSH
jgi:5-methylcytosine-specific restriction endonuclease McrA